MTRKLSKQERKILTNLRDEPRLCWLDRNRTPWQRLQMAGFITVPDKSEDMVRAFITAEGMKAIARGVEPAQQP